MSVPGVFLCFRLYTITPITVSITPTTANTDTTIAATGTPPEILDYAINGIVCTNMKKKVLKIKTTK